jgi:hypothetical protein
MQFPGKSSQLTMTNQTDVQGTREVEFLCDELPIQYAGGSQ